MEKLLKLLNIYAHAFLETNLKFTYDGNHLRVQGDEIGPYVAESIVINKRFGFIERLVKNDKLKDNGIKPRTDLVKEIQIVNHETGKVLGWKNQYSETEQLIMYLSIQDNPIEYLCSILK